MNKQNCKIGACIMVHNMAPFIRACIQSLQWNCEIFLYDDHSTDESVKFAKEQSKIPLRLNTQKEKDWPFKMVNLKHVIML